MQQAGEAACIAVWMLLLELLEMPIAHADLPLRVHRAVRGDDHMVLVAQLGYDAVLCDRENHRVKGYQLCQGSAQACYC